eukprot:COSAG05_NODE_15673_length_364_cov_0.754717_1_plen_95_part_10
MMVLRALARHLRPAAATEENLQAEANVITPDAGSAVLHFAPHDVAGIAAYFAETGIAVVDGALSHEEVQQLNRFCDESQCQGRWTERLEYFQPLL